MIESAERSVIGGAMLDSECARKAASDLAPEMFFDLTCRRIFEVITDLYWQKDPEPIDFVTVSARVPDLKYPIIQMAEELPSLSHYDTYVNIVIKNWQLHTVRKKLYLLSTESADIDNLLLDLENVLDESKLALPNSKARNISSFSQEADEFVKWVEAGLQEGDTFMTGFSSLDAVSGGLLAGSTFILAARPGQGKTDFAVNMAMRMAKLKYKVLYFSMEMTGTQMMLRIAANLLKVNGNRIRDKALTQEEVSQMKKLLHQFGQQSTLMFSKAPAVSVQEVRKNIEDLQPNVIVLDHLGLMQRPNIKEQYRAFGVVIEGIKNIALAKKIAVIELVQMNREIENSSREPELSDLRESGNLEQSADYVAFLRTKEFGKKVLSGADYAETTLYLKKNRHGGTGKFEYHWQPQYHNYVEVDDRYE